MQTFSQIKTGLDALSARIVANRAKLVQTTAQIQNVSDDLTAMVTDYGQFVQDVDAATAAAPTDPALINAKSEKDSLVSEFIALQQIVTTSITALKV